MVDLALLQSVSYIAGALGVCAAALYYSVNLKETTRNRRITLTNNLMQNFTSEEGIKRYNELTSMTWTNFDDFIRQYDSTVNRDNWMKRTIYWNACEVLGLQYKSKLIDFETLFAVCNTLVPSIWVKFKPVIEEYRIRGVIPEHMYENFEFLADEINRIMGERNPLFNASSTYLRSPTK